MGTSVDPDEKGEEWRNYETKARRLKLEYNKWFRIDFNPVVTVISSAVIWGLVIWCIVQPKQVRIQDYIPSI